MRLATCLPIHCQIWVPESRKRREMPCKRQCIQSQRKIIGQWRAVMQCSLLLCENYWVSANFCIWNIKKTKNKKQKQQQQHPFVQFCNFPNTNVFPFKVAWNFDAQVLNVLKFSMGQSQSAFIKANSIAVAENMNAVIKLIFLIKLNYTL